MRTSDRLGVNPPRAETGALFLLLRWSLLCRNESSCGRDTVRFAFISVEPIDDRRPQLIEHWDDGLGRSYYAGPLSYFTLGAGNAVRSWTPGAPPLGNVVLTDPGQMSARIFVGEELFYEVTNLSYGRIKVYSPANGARDLVSFGDDVSKRAVNFGTDGVDMVWVEAFGRAAVGDPWSTIDIVTAKYTTEAGAIQKRRLRSEGSAVGVAPFVVGCGYAARSCGATTTTTPLRLGVHGIWSDWEPQDIEKCVLCMLRRSSTNWDFPGSPPAPPGPNSPNRRMRTACPVVRQVSHGPGPHAVGDLSRKVFRR
jgi:hypothetical protein